MPKVLDDVLGELLELGKSTTQQAVKAVKSVTLDAVGKGASELIGAENSDNKSSNKENSGKKQTPSHTPLNFERLEEIYKKQDEKKLESLRLRLFQIVKSEEKKAFEELKMKEMERKRKEEIEEEEKKRQKLLKEKQQEELPIPKGKERRSIFAPKKVIKRSLAETRVGAGKQ